MNEASPITWIVAFRNKDTHEIVGPIWFHEGKRKPTNWAIARCYTSCEFAIMKGHGYGYDKGVPDHILQALEWKEKQNEQHERHKPNN